MKHRKYVMVIVLAAFFLLIAETTVYAHRLLIEPVEPGLIQIIFDDGSVAKSAEVIFYDEERQELKRGNVNSEGYYEYDIGLPIARVEANDGVGHRAAWEYGSEYNESQPILPRAMLAASVFVFIAAFFHYRSTQKRKKQA